MNLTDAFWPSTNNYPALKDYRLQVNFFEAYLQFAKNQTGDLPNCLISTKDRSNTDSSFIFHFKTLSINVKAGFFYVTKEAHEMMKLSTYYTEWENENKLIAIEETLEEMTFSLSNPEKTNAISYLQNGDSRRTSMIKIIITTNFLEYHTVLNLPKKHKFNKMLAFEIGTKDTPLIIFQDANPTNEARRQELAMTGKIIRADGFLSNNFFVNDGVDLSAGVKQEIESFHAFAHNRYVETSIPTEFQHFLNPPITYRRNLSPFSTNLNTDGEILYIYTDKGVPWIVDHTGGIKVLLSGVVEFSGLDNNKTVIIDGIHHYPLISNEKSHTWLLQEDFSLKEFNLGIFTERAIAFPTVYDNQNKPVTFKNLGVSFGSVQRDNYIEKMNYNQLITSQHIILRSENTGNYFVKYSYEGDSNTRQFLTKYKPTDYTIILRIKGAVIPTRFEGNDSATVLFLKCVGANEADEVLLDGMVIPILGYINLRSNSYWTDGMTKDNIHYFELEDDKNGKAFPLLIKNTSDMSSLTISLTNSKGEDITFPNTERRPQIFLELSIYSKRVQ